SATDDQPSSHSRYAGSVGRLSSRGTAELLLELFTTRLRTVVLAHLSQRCNTREAAIRTVRPALEIRGFRGRLEVALQDEGLGPLDLTREQGDPSGAEVSAPCPGPEEPGSNRDELWEGRFDEA